LNKMRHLVDTWQKISECELAVKFEKVVQGLLSCGISSMMGLNFDRRGYEILFGRRLPSLRAPSLNATMLCIVDFVTTMVETGYECFLEKSLHPIVVKNRKIRVFLDKTLALSDEIDRLPDTLNVDGFELVERARALYQEGMYLLPKNPEIGPFVKDLAQKFTRVRTFFGVPAIRKPPFSVLIYSKPGQGKTMVGNMIASVYAWTVRKQFNINLLFDPQTCMHAFNPDANFMDGYKGTSTWWIHCDDIARETKLQIRNGISPGLAKLISIINPAGMASEQAAIEDKGTIPVNPALVTASTNVKSLNAIYAVATPVALLRRLPFVVTPILKPQFKDKDGFMKKLDHMEYDAHTFLIEKVRALPNPTEGTLGVDYDLYVPDRKAYFSSREVKELGLRTECTKPEFIEELSNAVCKHEKNAKVMFEQSMSYKDVTYCDHHYSSAEHCQQCADDKCYAQMSPEVNAHGSDSSADKFRDEVSSQIRAIEEHYANIQDSPQPNDDIWVSEEDSIKNDYDDDGHEVCSDTPDSDSYVDAQEAKAWYSEHKRNKLREAALEGQGGFMSRPAPPPEPRTLSYFQRAQMFMLVAYLKYAPKRFHNWAVERLFHLNPDALFDFILLTMNKHVPKKVQEFITAKNALMALGGISAFYGAFSLFQSIKSSSEPSISTEVPVSMGNIWARDNKEQDLFVVPPTTTSTNDDEIITTVRKSIFRLGIEVMDDQKHLNNEVNVVSLGESRYLTVNHAFGGDGPWQCVANYGYFQDHASALRCFTIDSSQLTRIPERDLVIFTCASLLPRKPLLKYFPPKMDQAARQTRCITLEPTGALTIAQVFNKKYDPDHAITYTNPGGSITIYGYDGEALDIKSKKGDCGSVVVSRSSLGWFISGIRVAGSPADSPSMRAISTPISREILDPFLKKSNPLRYLNSKDGLNLSSRTGPLQPPYRKGIHTYIKPHSQVWMLGSFTQRHTHTSKTRRTMIADAYEKEFNIKIDAVPPLMKAVQEDGEWKNPYTIATQTTSQQSPHFLDSEINDVVENILHDTLQDPSWLEEVCTLDVVDAINGLPGVDFLDSLQMSTSGGFTFPGKKVQYFDRIDDKWYPKPELIKAVKDIEESYILGERANIIFLGSLKDEPVTVKKREAGKTRVFTACPVSFSIVVRKYFLWITKAMRSQNYLTECAVGMNCFSSEWEDLYHYLTYFGADKIVAGDYKAFDKEMPANIIRGAFSVLIEWRKRTSAISTKELMIMEGIATDVSLPVVNMNGDVFQFFGGNPSGQPLTAIINSIANSIYMRIAFKDLGGSLNLFKKQVHLMTYGDDNILNTDRPWFNHTAIQGVLKKRWVTYTMAEKDSESVPFINIEQADFLKRKFRHLNGYIVAPLAISSVHKMLGMMVEKGNVSEEQVIADSYLSARQEVSLHGEELFNEFTNKMESILENHPCIKMLFTKQHAYTYDQTLSWVLGRE